jgi:hypothetical protein
MANPHQPYWLWSGSIFFGLSVALAGVNEKIGTPGAHSVPWAGSFMIAAYVAMVACLTCLACSLRRVPFPFSGRRTKGADAIGSTDSSGRIVDADAPRKLAAMCKNRTAAQAEKVLRPYYGRVIMISGQLVDVSEWMIDYSQVEVRLGSRDPRVFMHFTNPATFDSVLSKLRPGTRITVTGVIAEIRESSITITDCELESLGK